MLCVVISIEMWTLLSPLMKVITLWEPLKPFLAILVEVCVLVAAILLYERSQSKKNCATGKTTLTLQFLWVCIVYLDSMLYFNIYLSALLSENGPNPDQTNTLWVLTDWC